MAYFVYKVLFKWFIDRLFMSLSVSWVYLEIQTMKDYCARKLLLMNYEMSVSENRKERTDGLEGFYGNGIYTAVDDTDCNSNILH
jgi:hypothetical protein